MPLQLYSPQQSIQNTTTSPNTSCDNSTPAVNITIRLVTPDDVLKLQEIARKTFYDTFKHENTVEDMTHYLNNKLSETQLLSEINNNESQFYFALSDNDTIIGYVKLNFGQSQTEPQDDTAVEIERLYVSHDYHGKGIGHLLHDKAFSVAYSRHAPYIWLGVSEENKRAMAFYTKMDFVPFGQHIFKLGGVEQIDIMVKKVLNYDNNE